MIFDRNIFKIKNSIQLNLFKKLIFISGISHINNRLLTFH